ncbi:MAG: precorrin-3B C(17)-methyltransferase [Pseudomonadota bacterium]
MSPEPAVVHLAPAGEETAQRLARHLGTVALCLPTGHEGVAADLRALFAAGRPIVAVMAVGILIRTLAPLLASKHAEPPVVAVAEDGSSAVPLLGGHHGANDLARRIAGALGGHAAITTAGDIALGVALDVAPPGWRLDNPLDAKAVTAGVLAGRSARLAGEADWLAPLTAERVTGAEPGVAVLSVEGCAPLVWRQRSLALGVGCARGCDPDELIALVHESLASAGLSAGAVAGVFSLDLKADEAAVNVLAANLDVPARFFDAATLEALTPRLATPSATVFREVGCHGVAEAAALCAAGPSANLTLPKRKTKNATCAVAAIAEPERWAPPGRPRGHLAVVGIGPGSAETRTPAVSRLVAEADDLVGYGLYIDLLGPLGAAKPRHDFPLGGEEDRCRHALELAAEGRRVVLVCSGDGGIYAMGALVMELLARGDGPHGVSEAARRVEVVHAPGISAMQAASAHAGALLGHDFCAISLSDLLTERAAILARVRAAAEGDFAIAFYNPVSARRRTLLAEARDILARHRPADTPVVLARNLGRPGEAVRIIALADLVVEDVDMLTTVLIGASSSRAFALGDRAGGASGSVAYTPRGYARKHETEGAS